MQTIAEFTVAANRFQFPEYYKMPQQVHHHTFPNGLTLLLERMDHVRSAAVNFLVPAGCVYDPPDKLGLVSIFSDMITRGAGDRDSRALTLAMDSLGLDHS